MRVFRPHEYDRRLPSQLPNLLRSRYPCILLLITLLSLLLLHVTNPYQISDSVTHLSHFSRLLLEDEELRASAESRVAADIEHELYKYQTRYRNLHCSVSTDTVSTDTVSNSSAWLTLVSGDDVSVVQAVVLGHVLHRLSCIRERVAAVRHSVSANVRGLLRKAGYKIVELPGLNCDGEDSRHVILGAWNLTQYDKVVYLDTATLPILSIDEVFDTIGPDKISSPYQSPPSVADTSFSTAMFGLSPRSDTYKKLLEEFQKRSYYKCTDITDLLWHYFSEEQGWTRLPYSYNVRNDRYFPMKSFNFGAVSRLGNVWEWDGKPTRQQAGKLDKSLYDLEDLFSFWWKMLYEGLERADLWHWWHYESVVYRRFLHSDPIRDFRAVDIY